MIDAIIRNLYFINGCVIYSEEVITQEVIDSEKVLEIYKNKTNYEIACNDIVYEKNRLNSKLYQTFGERLKQQLFEKFNAKFIIYIMEQQENDFFELRFHMDRTINGEDLWLDDNLDVYDNPIMIIS